MNENKTFDKQEKVWDFYRRYAVGSKLCPSCLLCGKQAFDPADWSIRHAELPDIYICKACVDAARAVPSATDEKIDKLTWQVRDTCARAENAEGALRLAQSALRQWTDLYARLQNESGFVVSRKLDYNLPPANHLKALEAIEEHFKPSYVRGEKVTAFEEFALNHYRHKHCMGCGGCILDDSRVVLESHPIWCIGCRDRIKKATPAAVPLPWDRGFEIKDGEQVLVSHDIGVLK